jgi:hypothetical protein
MLLIYTDPDAAPAADTPAANESHGMWMTYTQDLAASGTMLAGDALQPADTATTVRVRAGDRLTTDGPFAETKEQLAGFYLIEARDLNDAIQVASKIPPAREGSIEVRPIRQLDPEKYV